MIKTHDYLRMGSLFDVQPMTAALFVHNLIRFVFLQSGKKRQKNGFFVQIKHSQEVTVDEEEVEVDEA